MAQPFYKSVWIFAGVIFVVSCTKQITPSLNESEPQIVIKGSVDNKPGSDTVRISLTGTFYGPNSFPPVSGATVMISDNLGSNEMLTEISPGVYITTTLQGIEGRTYTLSVKRDSKEFKAISTMPHAVVLDSIYVTETIRWGETIKGIQAKFKDPENVPNFYRFTLIRNGEAFTAPFTFEDKLYDGSVVTYDIAQASEDAIEAQDSIEVTMCGIDKNVYKYFLTIPSNWEPPAVPANPISNVSNGALGYFSAETISRKTLIVQ